MADIPPGAAVVTPDQMWKAIQETRDIARELKTTVAPAFETIRQGLRDEIAEREKLALREQEHHDAHERAIRHLQEDSASTSWVPRLVWGVVCGVGGILGTTLVSLIIEHA